MPSSQNSSRNILILVIVCAFGALGSVLAVLYSTESASRLQFQITQRQLAQESDSAVQHFYQIQREQLELRLNELAMQEDLDELVLNNYRLRILQYSGEIETIHKRSLSNETETRMLEGRRNSLLHRARFCIAATLGFALSIGLAAMSLLTGGRGFLAVALLCSVAGTLSILNGFIPLWR
jgi:hypothetical protein